MNQPLKVLHDCTMFTLKSLTFTLKNSVKSSWSKFLQNSHLLTTLDWMHLSSPPTLQILSWLASFPLYMTLKWITDDIGHLFSVWHILSLLYIPNPVPYDSYKQTYFYFKKPHRCAVLSILFERGFFLLFLLLWSINGEEESFRLPPG